MKHPYMTAEHLLFIRYVCSHMRVSRYRSAQKMSEVRGSERYISFRTAVVTFAETIS